MNDIKELASLFTKLGFQAFGGPMAHIALMEKEVVEKRQWFDAHEFLEMISFTSFLPGPNSTEIAILIGYKRAKFKGMIVAGACFILPAVFIVTILTLLYLRLKEVPNFEAIFTGFRPLVAAIVATTAWKLSRKFLSNKDFVPIVILIIMIVLLLFGIVNEIQALLIGAIGALVANNIYKQKNYVFEPFSLALLFGTMVKIGSILYGSGYVLVSYLKTEFIDHLGWLNLNTLTDLLTLGEMSPGPVFTTATAVGTYLAGIPGGIVATLGIFTPSFMLIGILYPLFNKMKTLNWFKNVLIGINAVSMAIMIKTALTLIQPLTTNPIHVLLFTVYTIAIVRIKIAIPYLLLIASLFGILLY